MGTTTRAETTTGNTRLRTAGTGDGHAPVPGTADAQLAGRVAVVRRGGRPVGAFVDGDDVRWVELRRGRGAPLLLAALAVAGATAVGLRRAGHPQTIHRVTMGPGGWVSIKGGRKPDDEGHRPWWAVLLRAHRL